MKKVRYVIEIILLIGIIILCQKAGTYMLDSIETKANIKNGQNKNSFTVVIDSGHGGKDPGKVGVSGALEKDINLKIAQKIQSLLNKEKITVIMTREADSGLADSKMEDMKERVALINENQPILAVSIHQNSFESSEVKGAQVFYYFGSQKGKEAANIIQKHLTEMDRSNTRQIKANQEYYLLRNTAVPLVIIECGFLSNVQEETLLNTEDYQAKVAEAVKDGILEYLGK